MKCSAKLNYGLRSRAPPRAVGRWQRPRPRARRPPPSQPQPPYPLQKLERPTCWTMLQQRFRKLSFKFSGFSPNRLECCDLGITLLEIPGIPFEDLVFCKILRNSAQMLRNSCKISLEEFAKFDQIALEEIALSFGKKKSDVMRN